MIQNNNVVVADIEYDWFNVLEKPQVPLVFNDDPVALSCASYRIGEETGARWQDLDMMKPTEEDRVEAAKLKKYYLERLVMERLVRDNISPFRQKMGAFLAGNHVLTKKDVGLLYKLPYFFAEDQAIDTIIEQTENIPDVGIDVTNNVKKIKPLKRVFQSRRASERTQFWFTTPENYPLAFTVPHTNSLYGLVESIFDFPSVTISGNIRLREYFGHQRNYYSIYSLRILDLESKHG